MLEALALEEGDTLDTDDEPLPDGTLPDDELFQSAAGAIQVVMPLYNIIFAC